MLTSVNDGWGISNEIALRWMPLNFTDVNIGSGNSLVPSGNKPFITWTSVDQDLQRHMASLGPYELTQLRWCRHNGQQRSWSGL